MAKKEAKTNAMRLLDRNKIEYTTHTYSIDDGLIDGISVAEKLNEDKETVFKTLVTVGKTKNHYVFVVPVAEKLDLKKAAKAAGEKNIEMIHQKELLPLTGYVHGGCSPLGMKKEFKTFINETALNHDKIIVSGGRLGCQIEMHPDDFKKVIQVEFTDIIE